MRRSIFGNLVLYTFALVLVIALAFTIYFTAFMEHFAIEQKSKSLAQNAEKMSEITYYAITNQSEETDVMFQKLIDSTSANTQSSVTVFDTNGFIIVTSGRKVDRNSFEKITPNVTNFVLKGQKIESVNIYRDPSGEKILTVGIPMEYNGEIYGGIMFNQVVPEIKQAYTAFFNRMSVLLLFAMLLALVFFYALSYKITHPIKKMSKAVEEFSKGNFQKRVHHSSKDEIGELAENINNMASSIENLERLRNTFISDVSHELRTPLTTISGFVEGIIDGTIPEESQEEYLEVVLSESKRLSRLITNLLKVSRLESGETRLERTDFDINELVMQSLIKFEMMLTPKRIDVSVNIPEGKVFVNADKDSISQVLINLINNAVKFTPEDGKISLDVDLFRDKAVISVTNSGPGIEPGELPHIWDRFYKADKSRSKERTGVGLGLYIVKRILNMHGEKITCESTPQDFTKFTFTLSKAKAKDTEKA